MNRQIIFLFVLLAISCKQKENSNSIPSIIISGQKFEDIQAEKLNSSAIEKAKEGNVTLASKLFFEALEIEPSNPTILSNIGLNYETQKQNQAAIEYYEKALQVSDSTYLIAASNLGLLYKKIGDFRKGIQILDFVIENSDDNKVLTVAYINRAFNYLGLENCEKAKSDLNFIKRSKSKLEDTYIQIEKLEKRIKNCVQHLL